MKKTLIAAALVLTFAPLAWAGGDPAAGQAKAAECMICHGTAGFPGIFYTLQLAGRNADNLVNLTNQYRTGKIVQPVMNMAVMFLNDKDVADIAAYYHSLGKPVEISPYVPIKGDQGAPASVASAPAH